MGGNKIEKLTETNLQEWHQRTQMVLALCDLDDVKCTSAVPQGQLALA